MKTIKLELTLQLEKEIPEITDLIAGRIYTMDGVVKGEIEVKLLGVKDGTSEPATV